jgi:hypothetical protein
VKARDWQNRSRKSLKPVSAKRRAAFSERDRVRQAVFDRAGGRCEYASVVPEVCCGLLPGRGIEVDELRGGAHRVSEWLDVDRCRLTCPVHHDWKTANKRELLARLETTKGQQQ